MKNKNLIFPVLLTGLLSAFFFTCKKETSKTVPTVAINEVATVTGTTATLKIEIINNGGAAITERGICFSSNKQMPGLWDNKTNIDIGSDSFSGLITGLNHNTTYYVRAYAINAVGVGFSSQSTFTTPSEAATLITAPINYITSSSAISGGEIASDGGSGVTARGVCWSTVLNPTIADNKTNDGPGTGSFGSYLAILSSGTTYYVRAYATNSIGTTYGNQLDFMTPGGLPNIVLSPVTDFTATKATCYAEVKSDGGSPVIERGFVFNTSPNPTTSNNLLKAGTGLGNFNGSLYLHPGTTYYVRAYAKTGYGTGYSNEQTFTTVPSAPSLYTNAVTNITTTTATSGGKINYDGGREITAKGVCWSLSDNPTIADSKTNDGTGSTDFTSLMTGLTPGRIYYLRSYAINSLGTSYGYRIIFNTPLENCSNCEIVKIKYGASFNMCIGYCRKDLILSPGTAVFTKQGISGTPPPVTCTAVLSDVNWNALKTGVDITAFFSLPAVTGCPDCSDGGSEWIELELNHGETHRANWDYSSGVPASIKDYVALLRSLMTSYGNNCP